MSTSTVTTRIRKGTFRGIIKIATFFVKISEVIAGDNFEAWARRPRTRAQSYDPKSDKNAVKSA